MTSPRKLIIMLIEQGSITVDNIDEALRATQVAPDIKTWRTFIDHLLLWLGGLALVFSGLFFIAYNWNEIGRFAKFGSVEICVVLAVIAFCKLGQSTISGKVSIFMAAIFLGVLLALYGQTYQTGADLWQLFFNWALLILPWVFIGRFPAMWILWILLINLSVVLYFQEFRGVLWLMLGSMDMLWLVFLVNTVALIAWEFLARKWSWLSERWAIRLLAVGSGVSITWLALHAILDNRSTEIGAGLVWLTWLAALYFIYRKVKPDLFMLAGGCLSGTVVLIVLLSKHLLKGWAAGSFLFLALLIIGLGAGAAVWLRDVHRELES